MSKIKIITDAASDISSEDELKYGIRVIPFQVTLGDESYTTRVDMDNAQFYARMAQCDEIPKTAQVNPFQFQEIYLQEAQAGYTDLILVLINSEGSATYGNSLLAAEQFFEEHPEYQDIEKRQEKLIRDYPMLLKAVDGDGAVTLNEKEHYALKEYLSNQDDMERLEKEYHYYYGQSNVFSYGRMLRSIQKEINPDGDMARKKKLADMLIEARTSDAEMEFLKKDEEYQKKLMKEFGIK